MRMVPQSILMWCLLAAFLHCVISATLQLNTEGEKKLSVRLQRDLCVPKRSLDSAENNDTDSAVIEKSDQPSRRVKRGCKLLTCSVHDLAHRINQLSSTMNSAPPHKISPCGYGRRRRRALLQRSSAPAQGEGHRILTMPQTQSSPQKLT
ncbi:pro-adrenomedullin [Trichomycterus rosablanca]|uniref:pro-adrenomedullin n=1 Tax=Trichomycterus rosablanca TaxID=2290929 RepID=UPI002F357C59